MIPPWLQSEIHEVRIALKAAAHESLQAASRRVAETLRNAEVDLERVREVLALPDGMGVAEAVAERQDQDDEMRRTFRELAELTGQRPTDYLGIIGAVRRREGAGGKLFELQEMLRTVAERPEALATIAITMKVKTARDLLENMLKDLTSGVHTRAEAETQVRRLLNLLKI